MLTEFDDYLCHQTRAPIGSVPSRDLRVYEGHFITVFDAAGTTALCCGVCVYPNTDVMDGFALLCSGPTEQRNLRFSRPLGTRRHPMSVGPASFEVLEPLRSFRIACQPNGQGFSYDIVCETVSEPHERRPQFRPREQGRITNETCHYTQGYRCTGYLEIDGRRQEISPEAWVGIKAHSWGARRTFWEGDRVPPEGQTYISAGGPFGQGMYPLGGRYVDMWTAGVFEDAYLTFSFRPPIGMEGGLLASVWRETRPSRNLVALERRDVVFDPESGRFASMTVIFVDDQGIEYEAQYRILGLIVERGGGYNTGGTSTFRMGRPQSGEVVEGERWDLSNASIVSGMCVHVAEITLDGVTGYGFVEVVPEQLAALPYAKFQGPQVVTTPPPPRSSRGTPGSV